MVQHPPRWHPLLAAVETSVGEWHMIDSLDREYGRIRLVRLNGEPKYRVEFKGTLLGYGGSLRGSCERIHRELVRRSAPASRIGWEPERK